MILGSVDADRRHRLNRSDARHPQDCGCCASQASRHGVREGALHDLLHLRAAHKAKAECIWTLDTRDLRALALPGDPAIESP
jgi:hypothetical protein